MSFIPQILRGISPGDDGCNDIMIASFNLFELYRYL